MPPAPILLTRPEAAARRFAAEIAARLGPVPIVLSPVLDIVPEGPPPDLGDVGGVVLTSAQAVAMMQADWPQGLPAWCVGARTADAARAVGLDVRSAEGALPDLLDLIRAERPAGPLLHLRGRHVAGAVAQPLTDAGVPTREAIVYDQRARPLSEAARALLRDAGPVVIPVFSPRTARILTPDLSAARAMLMIAAISPAVALALPVQSIARLEVAERPDSTGVLDRIALLQSGLRA